jgi:PadR family transcriptional regulator, regulatory protein AphA
MELSSTAYVILGFLGWRPMSGYEIKSLVDGSTRFFWAASYGQIYPELRRLAGAGLIEGESRPSGGRRRTVYKLTPDGRRRLREWLDAEPQVFELRDEGLLKLFLASATGGKSALGTLEAKRRHHLEVAERLRAIEPQAAAKGDEFPLIVCRYGIECNLWMADWCERAAAELVAARDERERRTA